MHKCPKMLHATAEKFGCEITKIFIMLQITYNYL